MPTYREQDDILRYIKRLEKRLERMERSTQLANSSIEDGSLGVNDSSGTQVMQIGKQFDGTQAPVVLTGPIPPTPTAPTVVIVPGGLLATYDGTFVDSALSPMDFGHFDVVAGLSGFNPIATPPQAQIQSARGGTVFIPISATGTYQVAVITRTLAGIASAPSAFAVPVVYTLGIESNRIVGTARRSNLAANPQMEEIDSITPTRPAAWQTMWWGGAGGTISRETTSPIQGTASLKISCPSPTDQVQVYGGRDAIIAVQPGETFYFSAKFKTSRAVAGKTAFINVWASQTLADNGTIFNSPASIVVNIASAAFSTTVTEISGTYTIPAGYYWLNFSLNNETPSDAGGAYTITWDDVYFTSKTIRGSVISTSLDGTGARWEMGTFTGTGRYGDTNQIIGYTTHADEDTPGSLNAAASSSAGGTRADIWMQAPILTTYAGVAQVKASTVDPTSGSNYTEVELEADVIRLTGSVKCPANAPEEFRWSDATTLTLSTTNETAMSVRGGEGVFIAPNSGSVTVAFGGQGKSSAAGQYVSIGFEIRAGGTVGSGTIVLGYDLNSSYLNYNVDWVAGMITVIVTGLTPGSTYNTRNIAKSGSGTTAQVTRGRIVITPNM